jgi:two-component system alkaline phosphatase synthesis response regulator PhoP
VCSQTKRIAILSPLPGRLHELIKEVSAGCFDIFVFRRLDSLLDNGAGIDLYIFDFATADVYNEFRAIKAFLSRPDKQLPSIFLINEQLQRDDGLIAASGFSKIYFFAQDLDLV